jgi:hypothetical protein
MHLVIMNCLAYLSLRSRPFIFCRSSLHTYTTTHLKPRHAVGATKHFCIFGRIQECKTTYLNQDCSTSNTSGSKHSPQNRRKRETCLLLLLLLLLPTKSNRNRLIGERAKEEKINLDRSIDRSICLFVYPPFVRHNLTKHCFRPNRRICL